MDEIARLRAEIDALDDRIVDLVARRAGIAKTLGRVKRAAGRPLRDEPREAVVEARVAAAVDLPSDSLRAIYRELMAMCLAIQEADASVASGFLVADPAIEEEPMKRVTGLGGVFFQCKDSAAQRAWYRAHLGIESEDWGCAFPWREAEAPERRGYTIWAPFPEDTQYFEPSPRPFMINYRVEDVRALLELLREEGVTVVREVEESEFGKFAWVLDPEGNKVELWEPPPPADEPAE